MESQPQNLNSGIIMKLSPMHIYLINIFLHFIYLFIIKKILPKGFNPDEVEIFRLLTTAGSRKKS